MVQQTPSVTIRYATTTDDALLAHLGARTFYDSYAADNTPENMAAYLESAFGPEKQAAEIADSSAIFLIAESEDAPLGYVKLQRSDPPNGVTGDCPLELARIYVVKESHGRGVGAALMRACLDEARKRGHDILWLGVWERNPKAQAFYQKWGFVRVGSHIFPIGDDPQTDWVLQRATEQINAAF